MKIVAALYSLLFFWGLWLVVFNPRPSQTPLFPLNAPVQDEREDINLASYKRGAQVQVSSCAYHAHHPLFLIDEEANPSTEEKWMSESVDVNPWFEVKLGQRSNIKRVSLNMSGSSEKGKPVRHYQLTCYRLDGDQRQQVHSFKEGNNKEANPSHNVACMDTDLVRVDFIGQVKRVYEIELWGQATAPSAEPSAT